MPARAAIGRYLSTSPTPRKRSVNGDRSPKLGTGATPAGATTRHCEDRWAVGGSENGLRSARAGLPPSPKLNTALAARSRPTENEASCKRGRPLTMRQTPKRGGLGSPSRGGARVPQSCPNDGDPSPASSLARRAGGSRSGSRHRSRAAWRCPPPASPVRPAGGVVAGEERWCAGLGVLWLGPHCWQQPLPRTNG